MLDLEVGQNCIYTEEGASLLVRVMKVYDNYPKVGYNLRVIEVGRLSGKRFDILFDQNNDDPDPAAPKLHPISNTSVGGDIGGPARAESNRKKKGILKKRKTISKKIQSELRKEETIQIDGIKTGVADTEPKEDG